MLSDLLREPSDAARAELLDRAADRGFVLATEVVEACEPSFHPGCDVEEVIDELINLGVTVVEDRSGAPEEREPVGFAADPVRQYLNEAAQYDLLDAEQEQDLAKRIAAGEAAVERLASDSLPPSERDRLERIARSGERARERLIRSNLRLVVPTATRYAGPEMPMLEALQEGNLGLIRAVEKFDHTKGYKFSTYAVWWIRKALQRGLAKRGRVVRVPSTVWEHAGKIRRAETILRGRLGREPTDEEIGEEAGLSPERIADVRDALQPVASLDRPVGEDGDISLGALLPDVTINGPERDVTLSDVRARLVETLTTLPERERSVLELRYGLRDGEPRTLREVADILGLSRERVRQLESTALEDLRDPAAEQGLHDVFEALAA